jgi:methylated-DNA-protein-cysteine methyltransferase related protein
MNFKQQVMQAVREVPRGKVVSYGQVAARCGSPRGARQVGWVLHTLDGDDQIPWWRVINNAGLISIKGNFISTPLLQKKFLEREKVAVTKDFKIDIEKFRYYYSPVSKSKKSQR